jgi:hypothetical protein
MCSRAPTLPLFTQLILRERESRDTGRWETMRGCFWPDSLVRVSWFRGNGADFVTGLINMAKSGVRAKHRLAPVSVTLPGERAVASLVGIIDLPARLQGVDLTLSTYARKGFRASYHLLSYYLKTQGFDIDSSIAGEDNLRPSRF